MATPNQLDAIQRVIRTHRISEQDAVVCAGKPFAALTEDQANKLLLSLSRGELGGISAPACTDTATEEQSQEIYTLAWQIWTEDVMGQALIFINRLYPQHQVASVAALPKERATRVIVELDRLASKQREAVA